MRTRSAADRRADARYHQRNKEKRRNYARDYSRKHRYGLLQKDFDRMFEKQGGVCAICKKPETTIQCGAPQSLCVDHCHRTGIIRGLICNSCNIMLGRVGDCPVVLKNAIKYLTKKRKNPIKVRILEYKGTKWNNTKHK